MPEIKQQHTTATTHNLAEADVRQFSRVFREEWGQVCQEGRVVNAKTALGLLCMSAAELAAACAQARDEGREVLLQHDCVCSKVHDRCARVFTNYMYMIPLFISTSLLKCPENMPILSV